MTETVLIEKAELDLSEASEQEARERIAKFVNEQVGESGEYKVFTGEYSTDAGGNTEALLVNDPGHVLGTGVGFAGRVVNHQPCFIGSFPGSFKADWGKLTSSPKLSTSCVFFQQRDRFYGEHCTLSTPNPLSVDPLELEFSDQTPGATGKFETCAMLYGGGKSVLSNNLVELEPDPCWPNKGQFQNSRAKFGCKWFVKWKEQTDNAIKKGQIPLIICFDKNAGLRLAGECFGEGGSHNHDGKACDFQNIFGLGFSQRAEAAYIHGCGKMSLLVGDVDVAVQLCDGRVPASLPARTCPYCGDNLFLSTAAAPAKNPDGTKNWLPIAQVEPELLKVVLSMVDDNTAVRILDVDIPKPPTRTVWQPEWCKKIGQTRFKIQVKYDSSRYCELKIRIKQEIYQCVGCKLLAADEKIGDDGESTTCRGCGTEGAHKVGCSSCEQGFVLCEVCCDPCGILPQPQKSRTLLSLTEILLRGEHKRSPKHGSATRCSLCTRTKTHQGPMGLQIGQTRILPLTVAMQLCS
jgi:hypothetical protein